jgi:hypothetical protein
MNQKELPMTLINKVSITTCCAAGLMIGTLFAADSKTPKIGGPLTYGEAWGAVTNEFSAGIRWWTMPTKDEVLNIYIKTSNTNAEWGYFVPADYKLAKAELRDTNGVLLIPIKGKELDGELPEMILYKDFPRLPAKHAHQPPGQLFGSLLLRPNEPTLFWEHFMHDIYHIEKDGEYTLTICVSLYHMTDDQKAFMRMDLPSVSIPMHLGASDNMIVIKPYTPPQK